MEPCEWDEGSVVRSFKEMTLSDDPTNLVRQLKTIVVQGKHMTYALSNMTTDKTSQSNHMSMSQSSQQRKICGNYVCNI
jgi:hypothetical protein